MSVFEITSIITSLTGGSEQVQTDIVSENQVLGWWETPIAETIEVSETNILTDTEEPPVETDLGITQTNEENLGKAFTHLELQINTFLNNLDGSLSDAGIDLQKLLTDANLLEDPHSDILQINLTAIAQQILSSIQDVIAPALSSLISGGFTALIFGFLLIITMLFMFSEYEKLPKIISRMSPLDDDLDMLLFKKFTDTTRAVILGSFSVAIAQATAVSIMMIIMGIGAPVLMWMIMLILSLIPVGSGFVWAPVGIALMLTGRAPEGIILIIFGAVIINVIDTYLRPKVMKNKVQLHPLVIIFSALGGIASFGPLGLLYGPLIAVFFTSLMEVYADRYSHRLLVASE